MDLLYAQRSVIAFFVATSDPGVGRLELLFRHSILMHNMPDVFISISALLINPYYFVFF